MPEEPITSSEESGQDKSSSEPSISSKVLNLENLFKFVIAGIIASVVLIGVDLIKDKSLNIRINELEKEVFEYRKEINDNKIVFNCLKISLPINYNRCFK